MGPRLPVVGWEGLYEVDSCGVVYSLPRRITFPDGRSRFQPGRVRKPVQMAIGYHQMVLHGLGDRKETVYVHRLVALAFIGIPEEGFDHVNHINGVKNDNRVENLEWVSRSGNMLHSYRVLGRQGAALGKLGADNLGSMPVVGVSPDGKTRVAFAGYQEAARAGFSAGNIHMCVSGLRHTHQGFMWFLQGTPTKGQTLQSSRAEVRGVPPGCRLT